MEPSSLATKQGVEAACRLVDRGVPNRRTRRRPAHNYHEMQALTWRAKPSIQQDAILIGGNVIQHDGLISRHYIYKTDQYWCAAVSDGVSSSPKAEQASKAVLNSVLAQSQTQTRIWLQKVQDDLSTALASNSKTYGSSATLAAVSSSIPHGFVNIHHVGDSRVYLFRSYNQQWYALTKDHNFITEMQQSGDFSQLEELGINAVAKS